MTKPLLSLHVLAAVLAVGPVSIAASMFPWWRHGVTTHATAAAKAGALLPGIGGLLA